MYRVPYLLVIPQPLRERDGEAASVRPLQRRGGERALGVAAAARGEALRLHDNGIVECFVF